MQQPRALVSRRRSLALGGTLALALSAMAAGSNARADDMATPTAATAATAGAAAAASPAATATPDGHPTAAEASFVERVTADLTKRFPTTRAATAAGYLRYTQEDETGAISYANRKWTSVDAKHPSQLWYDVRGRLLGADFSVLRADSPQPPHRFGVAPSRWGTFPAHIHLGIKKPDGTIAFEGIGQATIEKGGGTLDAPTAAALVKAGVAPDAAHVAFVFAFPAIWDLTVWVLPNPAGAFADANPNVHPVHPVKDAG